MKYHGNPEKITSFERNTKSSKSLSQMFSRLVKYHWTFAWEIFGSPLYPNSPYDFSGVLNVTY